MEIQAAMENEPLLVARDGEVATVTLNRPGKKNAITFSMWQELASVMAGLDADPTVRAIVLSGAGADFSAGADIAEFDSLRGGERAQDYEAANSRAFSAVRNARTPVIAAIRGICFGGGFGLAAAADLRIATPDATFSVPAAKLGLAYPDDAMQDIVHSAGPQMARYLAFSGARIDAAAALAAGFLLEVVAAGHFDAHVDAIARSIAGNAPLSVQASKLSIRAVLSGHPTDVALSRQAGAATFASEDYAEGRAAFRERRKPEFRGK